MPDSRAGARATNYVIRQCMLMCIEHRDRQYPRGDIIDIYCPPSKPIDDHIQRHRIKCQYVQTSGGDSRETCARLLVLHISHIPSANYIHMFGCSATTTVFCIFTHSAARLARKDWPDQTTKNRTERNRSLKPTANCVLRAVSISPPPPHSVE